MKSKRRGYTHWEPSNQPKLKLKVHYFKIRCRLAGEVGIVEGIVERGAAWKIYKERTWHWEVYGRHGPPSRGGVGAHYSGSGLPFGTARSLAVAKTKVEEEVTLLDTEFMLEEKFFDQVRPITIIRPALGTIRSFKHKSKA